ncbi:hypothetical protein CMUS01_16770 [Colletotrichum musicola]|uniref:Uncharacterized protein n=1 Tax=Colletotrichum musicola TaxID=2175873 RepID=A0A8H6MFU3_9PEZI|nr:hypothetical protein CMUS01_16770 [Colletotrichum musicola]
MVNDIKMHDIKSWGDPYAEQPPPSRSNSSARRSGSTKRKNNNIRKDIEVAITSEFCESSKDAEGRNKTLSPRSFAFARGPKRSSKRSSAHSASAGFDGNNRI